ncbi:MAG: heme lyase CcmF/NrfE family subunit [Bryobacteraceae bacterium]
MENLGALALILAFCLSIYAIAGSLIGKWKNKPFLVLSAERAVYSVWFLVATAVGILVHALVAGDFRLSYVAQNTNHAMPWYYKVTAWWGGQAGSLMLWAFVLSSYAAVVVYQNRRKFREMMPYVVTVLMVVDAFFLMLIAFVVSPFNVLMQGKGIVDVGDGRGLNPLLQYWTMIIHPPILYMGYVGFVVPFAFAMASLITKQPGDDWIFTTRRWAIVTWFFQTTGVLLGAGWAYAVLGWGGYWGWDAVENASLLPWLTSTSFLHSVLMQEKKGMMKVWNMVLVSATFFLCIFGTTLTRTGIVSSVHAFAQSPIGVYFFTFLAVGISATVYLILDRLDYLKSESHMESVISRESSFLFNNLILLASCFSILWGTLFPVISEAVTGEKISVDGPFFNRVNIPIGLFLLFLTGVGPLIAWRRSSIESLKKAFFWPVVVSFALIAALMIGGMRHPYALMSFGLCLFVTATVFAEFFKGASAIRAKNGMNFLAATVELTHRNTRRYGGYLVHMGVVAMFIGFTGAAFNLDTTVEAAQGDSFKLGRYELKVREIVDTENEDYVSRKASIDVSVNGSQIDTLYPERRYYKASQQGTSEVAIRRRLNEDLYLNFAGANDPKKAVVQAYVFPLVTWIWVGFWILFAGTVVCLIPSKVRMQYARTEVVGIARNYAETKK